MSNKRRHKKENTSLSRRLFGRYSWLLILPVVGLAAYWNSFDGPFVFDDLVTVQRNTGVRFGDYFHGSMLWSRSLLYLTFALSNKVGGQNVWGYHALNLFLHLLNGTLVFLIARRILEKTGQSVERSRLFALLAACFFVVHPVQTESVTYISSRSELVSTFFYALALFLFIKVPERHIGFLFSLLIGFIFMLGLGGKETVISLPAALLVCDYFFLSKASLRAVLSRWRFYVTFFAGAVFAAYYILTHFLTAGSAGFNAETVGPWQYFLTQLRMLVLYARLLVFPVRLNLDYDIQPSLTVWDPAVIASALAVLGLTILGWYFRKRAPVYAFSIFWAIVTLAPTSSFVPTLDFLVEHRLYLPMIGICLSFPFAMESIVRLIRAKLDWRLSTASACVAVLVALAVGTLLRNEVWRDDVRLWSDSIAKSPKKPRGYNALSFVYLKRGDYEHVIEVQKQALKNVPQARRQFNELIGNASLKLGRYQEAVDAFQSVIKDDPSSFTYNNLGTAYLYMWHDLQAQRLKMPEAQFNAEKENILAKASDTFLKSSHYDSGNLYPWDSYLNVNFERGPIEDLESELKSKLKTVTDFNSLYGLGKIRFLRDDYSGAIEYFERAAKVDSSKKLFFFNYGYALARLGQREQAIEKYIQATRLDPLFIEAHHNVALLYMQRQEYATAIEHFDEVLRLDPNHVSTHLNLAKIYLHQGDMQRTRTHLSTAITFDPGNQEALALVQRIGFERRN